VDLGEQRKNRLTCIKNRKGSGKQIAKASDTIAEAEQTSRQDISTIAQNEANWRDSVEKTDETHKQFLRVPPARGLVMSEGEIRVDERNKALDVITAACFVVCRKFKRFKSTKQCIHIRSEPDVKELGTPLPTHNNDTKREMATAKKATAVYARKMAAKWKALAKPDGKGTEREKNPKQKQKGGEPTLAESMEEGEKIQDGSLSGEEKSGVHELQLLRRGYMPGAADPRTGVPLTQLVVALQEAKRKKALNLVQVLF